MRSIRGGSGLGDSLYVQSIARHLVLKGERLEVCAEEKYHAVFHPLGDKVRLSPHRRDHVDIVAHYMRRKEIRETDQFVDCCISAGIDEQVELKLDWVPGLSGRRGLPHNRPVIAVALPRRPLNREMGPGKELLPDCRIIQRIIEMIGRRAFFVQIGAGDSLFDFKGIDLDLKNQTTIPELIDAAWFADAFLGYVSFMVPLAESFGRPALFVWSHRGLRSQENYTRLITPKKILHAPTSRAVLDDCTPEALEEAVNEFLGQIGNPPVLQPQARGAGRERTRVAV